MKIRVLISLFFGALFLLLIGSCCKEKDYVYFNSLSVRLINAPPYYREFSPRDSTIFPSKFGLTPSLTGLFYSQGIDLSELFTSKVYAVQACEDGRKGSKEKIVQLSIVSNADIDTHYVAGTDLTEIFWYCDFLTSISSKRDTTWRPIDSKYFELLRMSKTDPLVLQTPVVKDSVHIFTVTVKLSDKRSFQVETLPITFKMSSPSNLPAIAF